MKKKNTVLIALIIVLTVFTIGILRPEKGGDEMYLAIYDRELNHITNITNAKYEITRRVFDFDTSTFEGMTEIDVSDKGFIFILCEETGKQVYSGFMQNIKQDQNRVVFKGGDFKSIFDTEVVLDYATTPGNAPLRLWQVFRDVVEAVSNELEGIMEFEFSYEEPMDYIDWIANYDTQYLIVNANSFLKPYLAYYQYRIKASFDESTKTIHCDIVKNADTKAIKLKDFIHESTKTETTINKAVATLKIDNVEPTEKMWIMCSEDTYNISQTKLEANSTYPDSDPSLTYDPNDYDFKTVVRVAMYDSEERDPAKPFLGYFYWIISSKTTLRPSDIPKKSYYLGRDNQIYEETIPLEQLILPIKAKVFEDGFFQKAQFNAISELVNNRYNENIIITNTQTPIDLRELELYTMIEVYDKNGKVVIMPVAEISLTNDSYTIKLGFKKTLFTEIVKSKNQEAIKNTNSGASGGTTIIEDDGFTFSETQPTTARDGSIWLQPLGTIAEEE